MIAVRRGRRRRSRSRSRSRETVVLLGLAVVLAIVVRTFFVQAFFIPSASMEPGLVKDDRILVEKVTSWFGGTPERGDVVVFADPDDWADGGHLVKRVVGVAGDLVACCDARGRLLVNGVALDEDAYLPTTDRPCNGPMPQTCSWTAGPVPEGHLFVMGDNRGNSADSSARLCTGARAGCQPGAEFVDADLVVGTVVALFWPLDRLAWVERSDVLADVPAAGG